MRGRVVRGSDRDAASHDGELLLGFVLDGNGVLERGGITDAVAAGDTLAIPAGAVHRYVGDTLVRLEIAVARIPSRRA